jgi:DEAD/DEAH box helicase domain-containing protein
MPDATSTPFAALLRALPGYRGQIVHATRQPARLARHEVPNPPLPTALQAPLSAAGRWPLYHHQTAAQDAARRGEHVGVVTGTASGKSLCYTLPILETLLREQQGRALLLFPTKSLLHDQRASMQALISDLPITTCVYDGDSSKEESLAARQAQIVISNPDKVHMGLIPYAGRGWAQFVRNLRFIVVDEAHTYSGVFGGHVALVLRRLLRMCAQAGSTPQIICCSATIGNPAAHLQALTGAEAVTIIDENGAPGGPREILFWQASSRRGAEQDALAIFLALLDADKQTLLFTANRQSTDRLTQEALERRPDRRGQIAAYRAGHRAADRRQIETAMREGRLRGLISTNANELGVNIGDLDAVVLCGYPGTVASFWQQAGRAGRRQQPAAAILVGGITPLEAYYFAHPRALLDAAVEPAYLPLANPNLLRDQLWCAAHDAPLSRADGPWFGGVAALHTTIRDLVQYQRIDLRPRVAPAGDGAPLYYYAPPPNAGFPPGMVRLRSMSTVDFTLIDTQGREIERGLTLHQAQREAHPGAIYHSQLKVFRITGIDYERQQVTALELAAAPDYITQAITEITVCDRAVRATQEIGGVRCAWGGCTVIARVTSYLERPKNGREPREVPLDLLPHPLETEGIWWDLPSPVLSELTRQGYDGEAALQTLAGLLVALLPVFSQADPRDAESAVFLGTDAQGRPTGTLTVYDTIAGGCSLARRGYEQAAAWLGLAAERLTRCPCGQGCPACIHAGRGQAPPGAAIKAGARLLARLMLGEAPARRSVVTPAPRPAKRLVVPPQPVPASPPAVRHPDLGDASRLDEVQARWPDVRAQLHARSAGRLYEYILAAEPVALEGETLVLNFGEAPAFVQIFMRPENRRLLESIFLQVFGQPYRLRCVARSTGPV